MVTDGYILEGVEKVKKLLAEEQQKYLRYGDSVNLWILTEKGSNFATCMELTKKIVFTNDEWYNHIFSEIYLLYEEVWDEIGYEEFESVPDVTLENIEWTDL